MRSCCCCSSSSLVCNATSSSRAMFVGHSPGQLWHSNAPSSSPSSSSSSSSSTFFFCRGSSQRRISDNVDIINNNNTLVCCCLLSLAPRSLVLQRDSSGLLAAAVAHKIVVWSSSSSSSGFFRGLSIDKTHIAAAESYFKQLHEEEEEEEEDDDDDDDDDSSVIFSAGRRRTFRNGSTQREQIELQEEDGACLGPANEVLAVVLAAAEISNVSNMDVSSTERSAGKTLSLSVHLQRPIKLNNTSSSSSQTISSTEEDGNNDESIINSQEPDDGRRFCTPHVVEQQQQAGNLATAFDNPTERAAAAEAEEEEEEEEMPEIDRIQDRLQQEHEGAEEEMLPEMERIQDRLQQEHEGGGGLINSSQHTSSDREWEEDNVLLHADDDNDDDDTLEYYVPSVGDVVIGVVVSGNHSKLDIDIGARKLGHMFVKDLISLDQQLELEEACWKIPNHGGSLEAPSPPPRVPPPLGQPCAVHDEEVFRTEEIQMPSSAVVESGTVFVMEVKGETMSGRPLLSTRSVARGFAWKRIRQIREMNQPVEIQITQWNSTGLVSRIEGVRAFLPVYHLFKKSSQASLHSLKDYVGRRMCVSITAFDEKTCNLIISEKQAWKIKNLYPGALVDGIVIDIQKYGARIKIKETDISGLLHISNIARTHIHDIRDVFSIGEEVKVMVVKSPTKNGIAFSTADLESEDGLMLTDKERVYREAEEMAKAFMDAHPVQESASVGYDGSRQDLSDFVEEETLIANWDWLDFDGK